MRLAIFFPKGKAALAKHKSLLNIQSLKKAKQPHHGAAFFYLGKQQACEGFIRTREILVKKKIADLAMYFLLRK